MRTSFHLLALVALFTIGTVSARALGLASASDPLVADFIVQGSFSIKAKAIDSSGKAVKLPKGLKLQKTKLINSPLSFFENGAMELSGGAGEWIVVGISNTKIPTTLYAADLSAFFESNLTNALESLEGSASVNSAVFELHDVKFTDAKATKIKGKISVQADVDVTGAHITFTGAGNFSGTRQGSN